MRQRTELHRCIEQVYNLSNRLSLALQNLSSIATEIYGEDLQADLCGGNEIEYRRLGPDGYFDAMDCIRLEDIEERL